MAATWIGTWKWMHVRLDVALHVGGPVCNAVVCPSTICYVHPWNEWHATKSTKWGNNNQSAMELVCGKQNIHS
ncbi:Uncharacterized protein APZ42_011316 [Daphnia magna]|uniref:Secreted protein n=1 Tax=Daphnia magna TaxID=35525 RepID=A0A162SJU7_9CRUS|nr:Uncharacterized protein APZ42_011316 [Daphnia magna]